MKVCYYLDLPTDEYIWFARASIASVRSVMPGAEVVLLTTTQWNGPDLGADNVRRLNLPMDCFYGYRKYFSQSMIDGDNLFLDVDCIVQKDVSKIFEREFDISVCYRCKQDKLQNNIPFNGGVVFSRCPEFWKEAAGNPDDHKDWSKTEKRLSETAMNDDYLVRVIDGNVYNYTPNVSGEDMSERTIVHYKGRRKEFLLPEIMERAA